MEKYKNNITVIDAICGKGKTSWAIQNIINRSVTDEDYRFIYITPYLDEVARVVSECKKRKINVKTPEKSKGKQKRDVFSNLISNGENIVITHSLFDRVTQDVLKAMEIYNYVIYLDEVHEVIQKIDLPKDDRNMLLDTKVIDVQEDGRVIWLKEEVEYTRFLDIKNFCKLGSLYMFGDNLYFYCFPITVFNYAKEVYILTYMFEGQIQSAYYKIHNVKYTYRDIKVIGRQYILTYLNPNERAKEVKQMKSLINLIDNDRINFEKEDGYELTSTWFKEKSSEIKFKVIKRAIENYFNNIIKGKSKDNMWTTLKEYESNLKGKGYTKGFVPLNSRATNLYKDKYNLAYVYNRYMNPLYVSFILSKNGELNENLFGLSELLQWVFRSRIRVSKKINLYLPSYRMRAIYNSWESLVNYNLTDEKEYSIEKGIIISRKDKINESKS